MRRLILICVFALACNPEKPAPPPVATTETPALPPVTTTTSIPALDKGSYDEALLWMRSTPKFHFVLDDHGVHAEGDMTRKTVGAEKVQFTANGQEWTAEATPQGVTWKTREGGAWKETQPPDFGARIYQRVTVAFDPQKKEGVPMLVSREGGSSLYRFTDANTGNVHEVRVSNADAHIENLKIGDQVELKIVP